MCACFCSNESILTFAGSRLLPNVAQSWGERLASFSRLGLHLSGPCMCWPAAISPALPVLVIKYPANWLDGHNELSTPLIRIPLSHLNPGNPAALHQCQQHSADSIDAQFCCSPAFVGHPVNMQCYRWNLNLGTCTKVVLEHQMWHSVWELHDRRNTAHP